MKFCIQFWLHHGFQFFLVRDGQNYKNDLDNVENIVEKKRKYWLPAVSSFLTKFSKCLSHRDP